MESRWKVARSNLKTPADGGNNAKHKQSRWVKSFFLATHDGGGACPHVARSQHLGVEGFLCDPEKTSRLCKRFLLRLGFRYLQQHGKIHCLDSTQTPKLCKEVKLVPFQNDNQTEEKEPTTQEVVVVTLFQFKLFFICYIDTYNLQPRLSLHSRYILHLFEPSLAL